MRGTSFVVLPRWLNYFSANVGYHHVHHLCAGIPNYRLVDCHNANARLFSEVPRVVPSQIPRALQCILWDARAQRIISIREYARQKQSSAGHPHYVIPAPAANTAGLTQSEISEKV